MIMRMPNIDHGYVGSFGAADAQVSLPTLCLGAFTALTVST